MSTATALSISGQSMPAGQPRLLDRLLRGRKAWTRSTITQDDYVIPLSSACRDEPDHMIKTLRQNPLDVLLLTPHDYPLTACQGLMTRVRRVLDRGAGFAIVDCLPTRGYSKAELQAMYWVLSSMLARPVAQSFDGTMLYDVMDTGKKMSPRVRADLTNQELRFHTDDGYNRPPPYFGLLVLHTARQGGRSSVSSLMTAHNEMRRRHPSLVPRLYRPFYLNRYREHAPGDPGVTRRPVFEYDGTRLRAQCNRRNVEAGYDLAGKPLEAEGKAAIEALSDVLYDPSLSLDFHLKSGQIEYAMNHQIAHRRTAYEDHDEAARKRHLVRIFLRNDDARTYMG